MRENPQSDRRIGHHQNEHRKLTKKGHFPAWEELECYDVREIDACYVSQENESDLGVPGNVGINNRHIGCEVSGIEEVPAPTERIGK